MKAYIGPHKKWFGPYQLFELFKKVGFSEHFIDNLYEKYGSIFISFFEWVYKHRKRKIKVKLHDYDVWGASSSISYIIVPILKGLRDARLSCIAVDDEDVPDHLKLTNLPRSHPENIEFIQKRWHWVLDEIIWAFEQVNIDWEEQYVTRNAQFLNDCQLYINDPEKEDFLLDQIERHIIIDQEGQDKHIARMMNGYRLFGKYYPHMWY